MLVLSEKAFFSGELLQIELHEDFSYRLRFGDRVEYENGRRKVQNRVLPYTFRSVEQLRYDFERDVAEAGGRLG